LLNQTTSLPSNEAETNETKQKVPATAGLQSSSGINRSLVFSSQENMDETTGRPALEKIALKM
jgi:shikimate kinase